MNGGGKMKKISSFLIILVIFALGTFFIINNFIKGNLKAAETGNGIKITVEIPSGSTTDDIAKILSDKGLIKSPLAFKYYAKKTEFDKKLRAGNFVLTKSMDADEILKVLTKGGSNENTQNITIVEGLTLEDTAKASPDSNLVKILKRTTIKNTSAIIVQEWHNNLVSLEVFFFICFLFFFPNSHSSCHTTFPE
jgi:UPF0755 protein